MADVVFVLSSLAVVAALFMAMLFLEAWGKKVGERHLRRDSGRGGYGAAETAVLGVLGLFIAFTFSGAGSRYDARHQLIADEVNAIETAWLRIDLLPPDRQPAIRDLFRQYLDARLGALRDRDRAAAGAAAERALALQGELWTAGLAAARATGETPPVTLMVPALNDLSEITTTRSAADYQHPPLVVFAMVGLLALVGSVFVGFGTAGQTSPSRFHTFGFAFVLALVVYVIIELEFPRSGWLRGDAADQMLIDLRRMMG